MNLPGINNKMKNLNNHIKQDNSLSDGFGLGIHVFKIESAKNIDANLKNKNRNMMKNIQNPTQTANYKQPLIPKPKKLPSLEKSNSQINNKQRKSAFINSKMTPTHTGYSDKINERKTPITESNNVVTPVSFSMRKKVGVSTEKNIGVNQTSKPAYLKNSSNDQKQKAIIKVTTMKLNQTAPPETVLKVPQLPYQDCHSQHGVIIKFYGQYQSSQKQHLKEIKQLKKLKQNEENQQICDRIEYLQSVQAKIESVIQNMEKQQFQDRMKLLQKEDDKKNKKMTNRIIPVCGFSITQMDSFDYNGIEDYQLGNFAGFFKSPDYQNIDFAPQAIIDEKQE